MFTNLKSQLTNEHQQEFDRLISKLSASQIKDFTLKWEQAQKNRKAGLPADRIEWLTPTEAYFRPALELKRKLNRRPL
jgi:hypothetical protein